MFAAMGSAFSLLGESMLLASQGNYAAVGSKVSAGGERGSGMFILLFLILSF
jgi:hypothetical protein